MLAINREPFYKNKLFLSGFAVLSGFLITVGALRAFTPVDEQTSQTSQSGTDRRASSLIPIRASDSETSSESGKKSNDTSSSLSTAPANNWPSSSNKSSTTAQNWTQSGSATTTQPSTSASQNQTPAPAQPSTTGTETTTGDNGNGGIIVPILCTLPIGCN